MFTATLFVESYDKIMPEFTKLLVSENYVTRRQSLKVISKQHESVLTLF